MRMADLVVQYRFTERCASIRNVNFHCRAPLMRTSAPYRRRKQKRKRAKCRRCSRPRLRRLWQRSRMTAQT
jgi:hypothetical protein